MIIPMESIKTPKRIIKKQLKNVNKAIVEIAEMKFVNIEEKEEKLDALVFLKNQILRKAEKFEINNYIIVDIESLLFRISYILKEITISHQF